MHADVAQLVEHHLAKVRVAGSSPVVRSVARPTPDSSGPNLVGWPRGEAAACKAVYTGSNPVPTSRAIGAAVARFPDTEEVTGSNPVSPTNGIRTFPPRMTVRCAHSPHPRTPCTGGFVPSTTRRRPSGRIRPDDDAPLLPILARRVREVEAKAAKTGRVGPTNRTKFQVIAWLVREERARIKDDAHISAGNRNALIKRLDGVATIQIGRARV